MTTSEKSINYERMSKDELRNIIEDLQKALSLAEDENKKTLASLQEKIKNYNLFIKGNEKIGFSIIQRRYLRKELKRIKEEIIKKIKQEMKCEFNEKTIKAICKALSLAENKNNLLSNLDSKRNELYSKTLASLQEKIERVKKELLETCDSGSSDYWDNAIDYSVSRIEELSQIIKEMGQ